MSIVILLFIAGLILVIKGGDWFVDSSVEIAEISGLPKIFIGATIVSLATTLPEVIVSLTAASTGYSTMAIGNAVGSMICNAGLIMSITLYFSKIVIKEKDFIIKAATLILYTIVLYIVSLDGSISRVEGWVFLGMLAVYMYMNIKSLNMKSDIESQNQKVVIDRKHFSKIMLFFVLGIAAIIAGSNLLIDNGVKIARMLNVPEAVIGLTIIALGTSLPELITGITSILKKNGDIGLGNIIGANILNVVLVIGGSASIAELDIIKQNLIIDIPVAGLLGLIMLIPPIVYRRTFKAQGMVMLMIYFSYILKTTGIFF